MKKNYCPYTFDMCFSLRSRKDLRELFDQLAMSCRSLSDSSLNDSSAKNSPEHSTKVQQKIGKIVTQLIYYISTTGIPNFIDYSTIDEWRHGWKNFGIYHQLYNQSLPYLSQHSKNSKHTFFIKVKPWYCI